MHLRQSRRKTKQSRSIKIQARLSNRQITRSFYDNEGLVRKFGISIRNDRGDRLIEFCQKRLDYNQHFLSTFSASALCLKSTIRQEFIYNTYMWKPDRLRYNTQKIQIHIPLSKTFLGVDITSDYNLVAYSAMARHKTNTEGCRKQKIKIYKREEQGLDDTRGNRSDEDTYLRTNMILLTSISRSKK